MDTPPAQDSPNHILNALSDYCIQLILRRLDDKEDFWSVAEVCKRFRANAISCYPTEFRCITISADFPEEGAIRKKCTFQQIEHTIF